MWKCKFNWSVVVVKNHSSNTNTHIVWCENWAWSKTKKIRMISIRNVIEFVCWFNTWNVTHYGYYCLKTIFYKHSLDLVVKNYFMLCVCYFNLIYEYGIQAMHINKLCGMWPEQNKWNKARNGSLTYTIAQNDLGFCTNFNMR